VPASDRNQRAILSSIQVANDSLSQRSSPPRRRHQIAEPLVRELVADRHHDAVGARPHDGCSRIDQRVSSDRRRDRAGVLHRVVVEVGRDDDIELGIRIGHPRNQSLEEIDQPGGDRGPRTRRASAVPRGTTMRTGVPCFDFAGLDDLERPDAERDEVGRQRSRDGQNSNRVWAASIAVCLTSGVFRDPATSPVGTSRVSCHETLRSGSSSEGNTPARVDRLEVRQHVVVGAAARVKTRPATGRRARPLPSYARSRAPSGRPASGWPAPPPRGRSSPFRGDRERHRLGPRRFAVALRIARFFLPWQPDHPTPGFTRIAGDRDVTAERRPAPDRIARAARRSRPPRK